MHCPACQDDTLETRRVRGQDVRIDRCKRCGGLWFDGQELERILSTAITDLCPPEGAEPTRRRCPRCGVVLFEFRYPQTLVKVDQCASCRGLWLDADEFKEVQLVRARLERAGELEKLQLPGGVKGSLISFINQTIARLRSFD